MDISSWRHNEPVAAPEYREVEHIGARSESAAKASSEQGSFLRKGRPRSLKKFQCSAETCGKTYSRAEHLRRHQLNHKPKQIYKCSFRLCNRTFVREDLLDRHLECHGKSEKAPNGIAADDYPQDDFKAIKSTTESVVDSSSQSPMAIEALVSMSSESNLLFSDRVDQDLLPQNSVPLLPISHQDASFSMGNPLSNLQMASEISAENLMLPCRAEDGQSTKVPEYYQNASSPETGDNRSMWQNNTTFQDGISLLENQSYYYSPFAIPDDFIQFLFTGNNFQDSSIVGPNLSPSDYSSIINMQYQPEANERSDGINYGNLLESQSAASQDLFHLNLPSKMLSEEKSYEISQLIRERFSRIEHGPVVGQKAPFSNDRSQDLIMMTRGMMQSYIDNFWQNFHSQLPILHEPTFSPDHAPSLLLIAIMVIGASCPEKDRRYAAKQVSTDLSAVLAWHLRWEIFRDVQFRPADLWVFQALLLLETFEKMFSTRVLHERAHIHHATTITLMRRGGALSGRSPPASPPSFEDSSGAVHQKMSQSQEWWEKWIAKESTRRVAFAAFVIDTTHATMFGHSAVMVTHEIRCLLPCDEALWSAKSASEVSRIESTLRANGVKPLSFLEGLQKTLNGQEFYTNAFGRSILMSGLLSVSWYMNQRDLQVKSLGVDSLLRKKGANWRKSITQAFDFWKKSYEKASESMSDDLPGQYYGPDFVAENRVALYHLAHMSMHVNIVECQVFAGARRVLGRSIGKYEFDSAQRWIRKSWVPTANARTAVFYAIRYICIVLLPSPENPDNYRSILEFTAPKSLFPSQCWILYSAALVVWCYSYSTDGPSTILSADSSLEHSVREMNSFLARLGSIKAPEDLAHYRLNGCSNLLKVLSHIFRKADWELLREGADLLANCIKLIEGG